MLGSTQHQRELAGNSYIPASGDGSMNGGNTYTAHSLTPTIEDYERVFGPAARNIKDDPQRNKRHQRWHLPDALKGPNAWMADRVDGLISDANKSPFTTIILPYKYIDNVDAKIKWNVWSFDEGLASRVPYEAPARVLTQTKRSFSGYTVRQGLAITMEHNFMMSEAGTRNFENQLLQMVGSIQQTNDLDVHIALITAPSYSKIMREKYFTSGKTQQQEFREYIDLFGFMQKNPNAMDIMIEEAKKTLEMWGSKEPNFLLLNAKVTFQMTMTPEKTQYVTQGYDGVKRLRDGPDIPRYRGLNIINTRAYSLETNARPRDVLRRRVRVAEYYRIPWHENNKDRIFQLYDESRDAFFNFKYSDCIRWGSLPEDVSYKSPPPRFTTYIRDLGDKYSHNLYGTPSNDCPFDLFFKGLFTVWGHELHGNPAAAAAAIRLAAAYDSVCQPTITAYPVPVSRTNEMRNHPNNICRIFGTATFGTELMKLLMKGPTLDKRTEVHKSITDIDSTFKGVFDVMGGNHYVQSYSSAIMIALAYTISPNIHEKIALSTHFPFVSQIEQCVTFVMKKHLCRDNKQVNQTQLVNDITHLLKPLIDDSRNNLNISHDYGDKCAGYDMYSLPNDNKVQLNPVTVEEMRYSDATLYFLWEAFIRLFTQNGKIPIDGSYQSRNNLPNINYQEDDANNARYIKTLRNVVYKACFPNLQHTRANHPTPEEFFHGYKKAIEETKKLQKENSTRTITAIVRLATDAGQNSAQELHNANLAADPRGVAVDDGSCEFFEFKHIVYNEDSILHTYQSDGREFDPEHKKYEIVIVRPHIEHNMLGVVMGRGGIDDLGATLWGQTELSCFDDGMHGIWSMSYKYNERAIVFNEKNLIRLWDVAYDGYNGGKDDTVVDFNNPDKVREYKQKVCERNEPYTGPSMIVMTFPVNEENEKWRRNWPSPIAWDTTDPMAYCIDPESNTHFKTDDTHCVFTDEMYKERWAHYRRKLADQSLLDRTNKPPGHAAHENETSTSALAFQGTLRIFNSNMQLIDEIAGCGHHGRDYVGVASARAGRGAYHGGEVKPTRIV